MIECFGHLNSYSLSDGARIGNKAYNLLRLSNMGVKIPETWIIEPSNLINLFMREGIYSNGVDLDHFAKANTIINELPLDELKRLHRIITTIRHQVRGTLVLRSSNSLEDTNKKSFAGAFSSILAINNTCNAADAVVDIWKSSFSETVREHCIKYGVSKIVPCSVIIQNMVQTRVGGVAMRTSGGTMINATYGLTKAIVDGICDPDAWHINDNGEITMERCGEKRNGVFPVCSRGRPCVGERFKSTNFADKYSTVLSNVGAKLVNASVPVELSRRYTLERKRVLSICGYFKEIANYLHCDDFDIEWCINTNDELYILQIRDSMRVLHPAKLSIRKALPLVAGFATGIVRQAYTQDDVAEFEEGNILLAERIDGTTIHVSAKASGCILLSKSPLSHSAIIAREWGIPCIGINSFDDIEVGKAYQINGRNGEYSRIKIDDLKSERENRSFSQDCLAGTNYITDGRLFKDLLYVPKEWQDGEL